MSIFKVLLLVSISFILNACKTCDEAWKEYRRSIDKKRLYGACTVNYDCVVVKELPNFIYTTRGMSLFEQEKSDGLKEDAKRICWDQSSIKAQDKNNRNVKVSEKPSDFKERPSEPCCVDNQCIIAYPGSCGLKVTEADKKVIERNQHLLDKAFAHYKKGNYKKSYKILEKSRMKDEQRRHQNFLMGISLLRMNKFPESYKLLNEVVNSDSNDLSASYFLMCAAHKIGKNDIVEPTLNKISEIARSKKDVAEEYSKRLSNDPCFDKLRKETHFQNSIKLLKTYSKMARG